MAQPCVACGKVVRDVCFVELVADGVYLGPNNVICADSEACQMSDTLQDAVDWMSAVRNEGP